MTAPRGAGDGGGFRPPGCASDLELEELIAGDLGGTPEEPRLRTHVDSCARCRERRSAISAVPSLAPDPAVWRPLLASTNAARRRRLLGGSGLAAVAAAAAIFTVVATQGPPPPEDRVKGPLVLTLHIKRAASGAIDVVDGEGRIGPGDEMRFALVAPAAGYAVVLGLDAKPSVTVYAPAAATAGGSVVLDGSIVADATAGAERVVAILCDAPVDPETLRARAQAALTAAGGNPEAVTSLASGCREASVLLRKEAR